MSHITTAGVRAVLFAVALCLTGCGSAGPSDSTLAYCLATVQQTKFVDAAVALAPPTARGKTPGTIAGPKGDLTIADWRKDNDQAFNRVCDAIRPADPPSELTTAGIALVNLIMGALLAGGTAAITANITRRRQISDTLRESTRRLTSAVASYIRIPDLPDTDVRDRISMVEAALDRARSARRRYGIRLDATLQNTESLRSLVDAGRPMNAGEPTASWADDLRSADRDLRQAAEAIAAGLDRTWSRQPPALP